VFCSASRRRHTRSTRDWSSDVCSSDLIAGRQQDTVMKIDYETEEIGWILSAPDNWDEEMEQYLVEGTGDDFEYTGGQHNATVLPDQDDNPDTIDILVYDNNIHITHGEND